MPIPWSDDYLLGVESVDKQHMGIFEIVHRFHEECSAGQGGPAVGVTLGFLKYYTETHFLDEEALMKASNYPKFEEHRATHEAFLRRLEDLRQDLECDGPSRELADDTSELIQKWLVDHIAHYDREFAPYVA